MSLLSADGVRVEFGTSVVVRDVSLSVAGGEVLGIVGESGSGKSQLLRALMGLRSEGVRVSADRLDIGGVEFRSASQPRWRAVRGSGIALVSQDALGALDPLRRVGREVGESALIHRGLRGEPLRRVVVDAMAKAAIPSPQTRAAQFPFQLSGGLRQRALIASAVVNDPNVILADEPTTALDATAQRRVLDLLRKLATTSRGVIFVSHDLAAVARIADRVMVMQRGAIVESGPVSEVLTAPQHPYTRELVVAAHRHAPVDREISASRTLVNAHGVSVRFGEREVVKGANLTVREGTVLGIVGESGSGKTTLARVLVSALSASAGSLSYPGWDQGCAPRGAVQFVSQHPRASLNPSWTVARSLREALSVAGCKRAEREAATVRLLERVGLDESVLRRRPQQLSGGQVQRVAIARALASEPKVLVLDEPLSALDVTLVARMLDQLRTLRDRDGVAIVLISHDLGVVGEIADEVIVMRDGAVVEEGRASRVFRDPKHPFTAELLSASATFPRD